MTQFSTIKEAHDFFSFPGIANKRYIYDKEGMVRIYSIPGYGDLFQDTSITFWTKKETMGKHCMKSKKEKRPIKVFRKQGKKEGVMYLGEWYVHDITFSYILLKKEP